MPAPNYADAKNQWCIGPCPTIMYDDGRKEENRSFGRDEECKLYTYQDRGAGAVERVFIGSMTDFRTASYVKELVNEALKKGVTPASMQKSAMSKTMSLDKLAINTVAAAWPAMEAAESKKTIADAVREEMRKQAELAQKRAKMWVMDDGTPLVAPTIELPISKTKEEFERKAQYRAFGLPWQQGKLLQTPSVRTQSPEWQMGAATEEARRVFTTTPNGDMGRLIARLDDPRTAEFIVRACNTYGEKVVLGIGNDLDLKMELEKITIQRNNAVDEMESLKSALREATKIHDSQLDEIKKLNRSVEVLRKEIGAMVDDKKRREQALAEQFTTTGLDNKRKLRFRRDHGTPHQTDHDES